MRIAHVLTFYDSLRNVLFLNHFVRVLTHTRHYSSFVGAGLTDSHVSSHESGVQDQLRQTPAGPPPGDSVSRLANRLSGIRYAVSNAKHGIAARHLCSLAQSENIHGCKLIV